MGDKKNNKQRVAECKDGTYDWRTTVVRELAKHLPDW